MSESLPPVPAPVPATAAPVPTAVPAPGASTTELPSLLVTVTCGAEAAERANQAWTVAAMAAAVGTPVTVWLTGEAVWFAVRDRQPDLALDHATPMAELVEDVRAGGTVLVCTQCAARRDLVEGDLLDGVTIAGAAGFVERLLQPGVRALVY